MSPPRGGGRGHREVCLHPRVGRAQRSSVICRQHPLSTHRFREILLEIVISPAHTPSLRKQSAVKRAKMQCTSNFTPPLGPFWRSAPADVLAKPFPAGERLCGAEGMTEGEGEPSVPLRNLTFPGTFSCELPTNWSELAFVLFCFEIKLHYVPLAVLEDPGLPGVQKSACPFLHSAMIKDITPHPHPLCQARRAF